MDQGQIAKKFLGKKAGVLRWDTTAALATALYLVKSLPTPQHALVD
jgi:hypothetical protein